jgi:hypothetical protein
MLRAGFIMATQDAGVPLRDVQIAARHADPRTTTVYDRRRENFDRHAAYVVAPISISTDATSDADLQSADSGGVDPDPRITLDDLREDVVAVWAAENDAGATVDVNGANRSGCATAGTGPNRGCHLDCEHFLQ